MKLLSGLFALLTLSLLVVFILDVWEVVDLEGDMPQKLVLTYFAILGGVALLWGAWRAVKR